MTLTLFLVNVSPQETTRGRNTQAQLLAVIISQGFALQVISQPGNYTVVFGWSFFLTAAHPRLGSGYGTPWMGCFSQNWGGWFCTLHGSKHLESGISAVGLNIVTAWRIDCLSLSSLMGHLKRIRTLLLFCGGGELFPFLRIER